MLPLPITALVVLWLVVVKALTREEGKLITRRRLLESAAKLLGETGYGALSVSAVARAAGVAQPTFYVHFRDKDHLLQTLALGQARRDRRLRHLFVRIGANPATLRGCLRLVNGSAGLSNLLAPKAGS